MKEFLEKIFKREGSFEESDILLSCQVDSIKSFDPKYKDLERSDIDMYLDIKKKPDFSRLENKNGITLRQELKEYWSQFWCPSFTMTNKKAITELHDSDKIFVNLLGSPDDLLEISEDIEMYTEEMNEMGFEGIFVPIAFKDDGWNILFNNENGCIYIQEHDPIQALKIAESIKDFYS